MTNNYIFRLSTAVSVLILVNIGILRTEPIYSRNELEIQPNSTEFSITPDTPEENCTFTCRGTEPIQWYFRQYDGKLIKKNFSTRGIESGEKSNFTHSASLSLSKATYLDTGYYICAPSEDLYYHKEVYIYVHHKTHLFAISEDFKLRYDQINGKVVVPSRPTSVDVNVSITSNYEYLNEYLFHSVAEPCHPINMFQCQNILGGTCIPDFLVCEGSPECIDGSDEDEVMCKERTCHPNKPFKCGSLECLFEHSICDGRNDCKDGSDETDAMCQVARMCNMKSQFKCTDFDYRNKLGFDTRFNGTHQSCILRDYNVCDGIKSCGDGSDEDPKMCQEKTCDRELQFECKSGQCIDSMEVCNGMNGCPDGSDEDPRMCENFVLRNMRFNERIGFQMDLLPFLNISFTSVARKNHITESRRIPNPFDDLVLIKDSSLGPVLIGQNLTLNCSLEPIARSVFWTLKWMVPGTQENETQNERIGYEPYANGSILLHIKNVSNDDAGDYVCIAKAFNGLNYTKTYKLNARQNHIDYTNLKIDDGIHEKIRPAGYDSVQWRVIISSIGNTSLEWRGPNGRILETKSPNTCVNDNCVSDLIVTDLKLADSGVYKLTAYNGAEINDINVTLIVED